MTPSEDKYCLHERLCPFTHVNYNFLVLFSKTSKNKGPESGRKDPIHLGTCRDPLRLLCLKQSKIIHEICGS